MVNLSRIRVAALIVGITPYFLERENFWFEKNLKKILTAAKTQSFFEDNTIYLEKDEVYGFSSLLRKLDEIGYTNAKLAGAASILVQELKDAGCKHSMRKTVLGHIQRGGVPIAYDRVLATQFGVKAFGMVLEGRFGEMVSYKHPYIISVPFKEAISKPHFVTKESDLMKSARGVGISFGD